MEWISRADWGARPAKTAVHEVKPSERTAFLSHYDGGSPIVLPNHDACYEHVRRTQRYHQDTNGWSDIGYNTLGCPHGGVFEGRGLDKVGAHCPDFNRVGHGHQFMLGADQQPTPAALEAAREVYDLQSKRSGNTLRKMGHRDGFATACPGENVHAWVKAGMPAPTGQEDEVTPEDRTAIAKETVSLLLNAPTSMFTIAGDKPESLVYGLARTARNVEWLTVQAKASADTIAAAVLKQLPADSSVDDAALTRAFLAALTELANKE